VRFAIATTDRTDVADDYIAYWSAAAAQMGKSGYYPKWAEGERRLDFTQSVESILRRVRAFGPLECPASVNNTVSFVRRAVGWTEPHEFAGSAASDLADSLYGRARIADSLACAHCSAGEPPREREYPA
jgi:hypothetical protein